MSDVNEETGHADGNASDTPSIASLIESPSWEQRVAAAREKRMKVLALKEQEEGKADDLPPEEPAAAVDVPLVRPDLQEIETDGVKEQDVEEKGPSAAEALLVAPAQAPTQAPTQASAQASAEVAEKRPLKGGLVLLAACGAALGLGVVLGAGFVMSTQSDRSAQTSDVAQNTTNSSTVEVSSTAPIATAPIATAAPEETAADIALTTPATPAQDIALDIAQAPSIGDIILSLPKQLPNRGAVPGMPLDVSLVNYSNEVPPLLSPLPEVNAVKDMPQPARPEVSFDLGSRVWDLAAGPSRVFFETVETPSSEALSLEGSQSLVPPAAIDATVALANLDAAPTVDIARAGVDVFVLPPSINLSASVAPETVPEAFGSGLASSAVLKSFTSGKPGLILPVAPRLAVFPPEVDTWNGIPTRPVARPTLASKMGYVGEKAETVNLVMHAPGGIGQDALDAQTQRVNGTGFILARTVRPQFKISQSHLRFYNESDRELATAIATEMGFALRDFSSTNAPAGLVEIWLEGGPTSGATRPSTTPRAAKPQRQRAAPRSQSQRRPANPLDQMRRNLANRLRNGDHL